MWGGSEFTEGMEPPADELPTQQTYSACHEGAGTRALPSTENQHTLFTLLTQ